MTNKYILDRITEAVNTIGRLPPERPGGFRSSMPTPVKQFWESFGQDGDPLKLYIHDKKPKLGPPDPRAIDRSLEVLGWLQWVSHRDRDVLWARGKGVHWYKLAGRYQRAERTIQRWHVSAARYIVLRLALEKNTKCA